MKVLLAGLVIAASLFAQDSGSMTIHKTKKFVDSITPDRLSTRIALNVTEKDYTQASNTLSSLSTVLKKYEKICKNSGYAINKALEWDKSKGKSVFIGYKGTLNFKCQYDKPSQLEKFYNEPILKKLIENNKKVSVTNFGTQWIVSKHAIAKKKENLERRALLYSAKYAKRISKLLERRCTTKSIDLSPNTNSAIPLSRQEMILSKGTSTNLIHSSEPTKEDAEISYIADYTFICKE
ncbi:MAG: SIMPL domain-containing protein [Sulfurospirillaceae bacterium]|nr:SIMPL domain-containing protein [Sulfurospirillaceae bacterium]